MNHKYKKHLKDYFSSMFKERLLTLTFFSDTHGKHEKLRFTGGDILVFCGDFSQSGGLDELRSFVTFIKTLNYRYFVMIAGNHDFCFENSERVAAEKMCNDMGIIYLNDSGVTIEDLRFWGSPYQPTYNDTTLRRLLFPEEFLDVPFQSIINENIAGKEVKRPWFRDWAFNRDRGDAIEKHWKLIPKDSDVILIHGPPYGILDKVHGGSSIGCRDQIEYIKKIKPLIHAFGHIHESAGKIKIKDTIYINACNLMRDSLVVNDPINITVSIRKLFLKTWVRIIEKF